MSTPAATKQRDYRPGGFCPQCCYATDVGTCPECGSQVTSENLLFSRREFTAAQWRRRVRRVFLLGFALLLVYGGYRLYESGLWIWQVPNNWVLSWAETGYDFAIEETQRRVLAREFSPAQMQRLLDHILEPVPPKPAYPASSPRDITLLFRVKPGFEDLLVELETPRLVLNGVVVQQAAAKDEFDTRSLDRATVWAEWLDRTDYDWQDGTNELEAIFETRLRHHRNDWWATYAQEQEARKRDHPLELRWSFRFEVTKQRLRELVTLARDDAAVKKCLEQMQVGGTFDGQWLTVTFANDPTMDLAVKVGIRADDADQFHYIGMLDFRADPVHHYPIDTFGMDRYGFARYCQAWRHGPAGCELYYDLPPEIATQLAGDGKLDLRFSSGIKQSRFIAFERDLKPGIIGSIDLFNVVTRIEATEPNPSEPGWWR